ncbi:MAG: hypothetical protein HXY29_07025 [Rhodocyclaceae bacterium]|jgi:hypothetical protein|nr:hypothetical protein [Rhodocyclaceae bacterium]
MLFRMAPNPDSPFGKHAARLAEFRQWASVAKSQTGKDWLTQAREIWALKHAGGRCGVTDYYWFRLYDESYLRGRGAKDFLGWRLQDPFNFALNPRHAVLPAWDKLVFHQLASAAGLPVAPLKAVYHPGARLPAEFGVHLRTAAEVEAYLRCQSHFPLFAKPAFSQQGVGVLYLTGYDRGQDSLLLAEGGSMLLSEFMKRVVGSVDRRYHKPECGFLFQEPLRLAPEIERLTGWPAICGVRIVCLNGPDCVVPIGGAWKIAVAPNVMDNFHMGAYGNLVAEIDLTSGEVGRVADGLGPSAGIGEIHPRTGRHLSGFRLPDWPELLRMCRLAGPVFPLMKVHHWDFALTDRGPVILELNDMGGTQIVQLFGQGLLTEFTRDFLKRYADRAGHPWINDL